MVTLETLPSKTYAFTMYLWHIEAEELRRRCAEGRIKGAKQVRGIWLIPQ